MTNMALVVSLILSTPQLRCGDSDLGRCVRDSLFNEIVRLDRAADAAWAACDTPQRLAARQREVREKTIAAIGGLPEKTPLNARVVGVVKKDGYVIEKILFESRPRHYVTAHLFLPDDPKFKPPYPGVVSPCGHSATGKLAPWYQRVGVTGAKHGLATLVYDPIDQGERRQHPKCPISCGGHNNIGHRATLLGWNTAQFRVWDGMRACDYLASRPDVDASKLGVTGLSGGGTLSSYLNALDPRYAAGAPAGFLSTIRDVYDKIGGQDAEQFMFGQLRFGFNHLGIVLLRAPSPIMIVTTHGDYFPFKGSLKTFDYAKKIYSMLGVPERVDLMEAAGPHHWYESTRNAAMLWLRRWAAGDETAWPGDRAALRRMDFGFAYGPDNSGLAFAPREEARVTKTGQVMDIPGARSVYDVMRDELARLDESRVPPTVEGVRAVAGIRPVSSLSATPVVLDERRCTDGRAVRLVLSRDDDLTPIPLAVFMPTAAKGDPAMLVSGDPAPGLADEVKKLVSQGRPVAVAQLRGFGATAKGVHSFYGSKRADEEMAVMAIAAGQNLAALRAEDAALAARHFASMLGVERVALVAHSAAAIPAAHAYFLERGLFSSFATSAPPPSWHEMVRSPTAASSFANTVFGALRAYDWTDLAHGPGDAASLAGRWNFALGDSTACTDTITLPSTTDLAKKGDGRIGGVEVEKIDVQRDDASVKNRLTRHLTRRFPYVGKATYERDIEIPSAWAGRRVEIFLERTKILDAYLDGKLFAHSDTLAAPARLTLPAGVKPGRHRLRLVVDNSWKKLPVTGHQVSEDTQTNWNGVMGRMEMLAYGALSIAQMKTFPDAGGNKVTAKVVFRNDGAGEKKVEVDVSVMQGQQAYNNKFVKRAFPYVAPCGVSTGEFTVALGPNAPKWSEFNPVLHTLTVKAGEATATVKFGLRDFRTKGTQFMLNGRPMFLRGRHDACVWPLTGAAPMEVAPWRKYFATLKEYGLNHVRFHSWCPPEAAFEAADEAGFIMLPEFGVFGGNFAGDAKLRAYCLAESKRIIDAYGNHPSFAMFTLGNECRGGRKERAEIIRALRAHDPRPLYAIATNGDWNAPQLCDEDDFWATFRSCDGAEGNARGSYAHCNAPLGAVQLPGGGTMRDFSSAVRHSPIPVIGHETGQFQAYPDYSEIPKYTGVLKPINLEIFKTRLEKAGLGKYAADFCRASGRLMAMNYREEMEEAFRTPGFGGFQLLDLQDFPGQGTALVGVLNAFMESKGFITPERWRMSCSPTVLLARFPRYTYVSGEKFVADVQIAHYGPEDVLTGDLEWSIEPIGRTGVPPILRKVVASGKTVIPPVHVGEVKSVGRIELALPRLESKKYQARARWFELCLSFAGGKVQNSYPLWVYSECDDVVPGGVEIVRDLESADKALAAGRTALCILDKAKAPKDAVPGFFTTDFWNWEMFNGPARKRKVIAPGTLGLLVKSEHPALAGFPTSFHSDYQWRELIFNGVNVVLDDDKDVDVIVRGIDNITRNQNLGVIWEKRRGKGRVLYCSLDLEAAKNLPEARALRRSLLDYLQAEHDHRLFSTCSTRLNERKE